MARTKEYIAANKRRWYLENKDRLLIKANERYITKKETILKKKKETYQSDQAKYKARMRDYYQNNKAICLKSIRKRAGVIEQQTPSWLTESHYKQMNDLYKNCPEGFNIDHIIPLQGKNVSGLNVPWNLQYLTEYENKSKGNKHDSD